MTFRISLRGKITGFVFGKYNLQNEVENTLIKDEDYISGIEIIFYDEILLLLGFLSSLFVLYISISINPIFLLILIPITIVIYFSLEVELTYLTNERLIIERRTILEKLLKTSNIKSISLDQVAVISYSRAPFQYPSLFFSAIGYVLIGYSILYDYNSVDISLVLLPISLYLSYFGFRLTKRSIEISVIGVQKPFGIGRVKGAPLWFLNDLQDMIFERVHHTFHDEESYNIHENPLEYSGRLKDLVKNVNRPIQKKVLLLLDEKILSKKEIMDQLVKYSKREVDEALRQLRVMKYVFYHRSMKKWCLDKMSVIEDLETTPA